MSLDHYLAAVGDWNLRLDEVRAIAEAVDGRVAVGHEVDRAIYRGLHREAVRQLGELGSDHQAILWTFTDPVDGYQLRVLWWNVWVGQKPETVLRTVATLVDQHQPHIVALCETYRCGKVLGQIPGYRRSRGFFGEGRDITVLVRRDLNVLGRSAWRMVVPWVHHVPKTPRVYRRVRLELPSGQRLRFAAVHLPTGGPAGPSRLAVSESIARIQRWGRRH